MCKLPDEIFLEYFVKTMMYENYDAPSERIPIYYIEGESQNLAKYIKLGIVQKVDE